jgi:site-specific DNA-cytosine methylase
VRETSRLPRGLDSPRYRTLGNAVTVPVAHWIGERIMRMAG